MKIARILIMLLVVGALPSCFKEDNSNCDVDRANVIFSFGYMLDPDDEGKTNLLDEYIDEIDLLIFDNDQQTYTALNFSTASLGEDKKIAMKLPDGVYYAVAWGNVESDRTGLENEEVLASRSISLANSVTSIDPMFYAPDFRSTTTRSGTTASQLILRVESNEVTEHPINFMGAHHIMQIWLRDFPDMADDELPSPVITINDITAGYDFLLRQSSSVTNLTQPAIAKTNPDGEELGFRQFLVPHFNDENNITINISGIDGNKDYSLSIELAEILKELDEIREGYNETIVFELQFDGDRLKIIIPKWGEIPVGPGLG